MATTLNSLAKRLKSIENITAEILAELKRMNPQVEAAFNDLDKAIVDETEEFKVVVANGGNPQEIIDRINAAKVAVQGMSDAVNPPTG